MSIMKTLGNIGIVPVSVIEDATNAVPTARAMADGGIPAIEITLRTAAGLDAIEAVAKNCSDICVGAGTVLNLDDEKRCLDKGAKFIVSPGFDRKMADWSIKNNIPYLPGCVTPTEIMAALEMGINIVKFFPANVYGGLSAMKALAAPFTGVKFMPTGGVSGQNVAEFLSASYIHAVGGSWVCAKADVNAGQFEKIRTLSEEAVRASLGFEVAHVGINNENAEIASSVCTQLQNMFGFSIKEGNSSSFASGTIEVMKSNYLGEKGHLAIRTTNMTRAIYYLSKKGYSVDESTYKYKNGAVTAAYLKDEVGGFAIHLLQK